MINKNDAIIVNAIEDSKIIVLIVTDKVKTGSSYDLNLKSITGDWKREAIQIEAIEALVNTGRATILNNYDINILKKLYG